jgi:hypothetical protein
MAKIAQTHSDELPGLKDFVEDSYMSFKKNYERFHKFRRFIFDSALTSDDKDKLKQLKKPIIEVNILEQFISRLLGEFSKQQPSINVSSNPQEQADPRVLSVVDGYMRNILLRSNKSSTRYEIYKDMLSGGFSVGEVYLDYENPMSIHQNICIDRVFDPTLCGFDPLAKDSHKGDGKYCYKIYPKTKEDFECDFPGIDIAKIDFTRSVNLESFNWSYKNGKQEILLVCDFYKKKEKRQKLIYAADGRSYTKDQYDQVVAYYSQHRIEQAPAVVTSRWTTTQIICRYRFIGNQVLEYEETVFDILPLVFFDGSSIMLREEGSSNVAVQYTRPYVYHALDAQRVKNFALQTFANEIENMPQHKLFIDELSIPEQYQDAYQNPQKASAYVYKSRDKSGNPLNPPSAVLRQPMPPEISQLTFGIDQTIQTILGVFDAQMGNIGESDLSGKAIIAGATQSNATALPYVEGFIQGFNQIATICLSLIPKINTLPRNIPVLGKEGKTSYARINDPKQPSVRLNYSPYTMNVVVEAGVNYEIQKDKDLQVIIGMMKVSPLFAQFINDEGLPFLLSNLNIHDIDQLKDAAEKYSQKMKKQQEQAQQAAQQGQMNNPAIQLEQTKLQMANQQHQDKMKIESGKLQLEQQKVANEGLKVQLQAAESRNDMAVQADKAQAERAKAASDVLVSTHDQLLKHADQDHRHAHDALQLHHQLTQPQETGANQNG